MNKINGQKLLPPSKGLTVSKKKLSSSQLVPYKNIKQSSSNNLILPKDKPKEKKETLLGNVINIKRTVIKIEKLINTRNTSLLKEQKTIQKENENKKRSEREKNLETKKESKSLNIPTPNLPRTGIVDYIKNFLKWVIIGRAFMLFSKFIPGILSFLNNFKFLYDFFKTLTGAVFNGLVTFIEWSDKAQKKLREIVGSLGGEPFQKAFDNFSGALTTFANLALIAGMATMGGSDLGVGDALDDVAPDGKKPTRKKPRVTTSGGRTAGRPNIRNPLRQRPQITTGGSGTGRPRVTTSRGRTARTPKSNAPKVTGSGVNQGGKLAAKSLLKTVRPLLRGMVIGGLIDFGLSVALGENPGRAAFGAIGATLLGTIGGILGGPFAPFTAIGGGLLGDWAGRKLYDAFFTGKKPTNTKPQKKNQGGSIKPKTGRPVSATRRAPTIQKVKPPIKSPVKKTEPGKNVGGEASIRKLFPDPSRKMSLGEWMLGNYAGTYAQYEQQYERLRNRPNPFKALTKVSETLKSAPFVGRILGAPIDVALGQKPDKFAFKSFSDGVSFLASTLATNEINQSMSIIKNNLRAFAEGGEIPTRQLVSMRTGNDFGNMFESILGKDIENSFNKSLDTIRKEVDKKTKKPDENGPPGGIDPSLGNVTVTSDSPDFWLLVTAALFENGKPTDGYQGAADVAQAIYNRVSLPGWPKSIRNVILEKGQFQPVRQYGGYDEWDKIKNKQDAVEFAKKHKGYTGNIVEQVAASLLDKSKQEKARDFVGPRDNFRSASYEKTTDHLDDSTEVNRYGHVFGFEPGGANIKSFKEGKLKSAEVNKEIVTGSVDRKDIEAMVTGGVKPSEIELISKQGYRQHPITGEMKYHAGIDLVGAHKSPISSAQDAKVVHAGWLDDGYGNSVILRYSDGAETRFAHLDSVNVKTGQSIKAGQMIGRQGSTGLSTGSHLHFEYYPKGGAMSYKGYGDAASVKDSYFRYGGNVKAKISNKPMQPPQLSSGTEPNIINASGMALSSKYQTVQNLKPGQKIVFNNVGSIQRGKNFFGQSVIKYYDTKGKEIQESQFDDLLKNSKVLEQMKTNDRQLQNMQGGGYLDMNYKKINKPGMIDDYSLDDESEGTIYIQPVYIERIVPIPGKGNVMSFPGNSTALNSTSAGSRNLAR